jgi:DNA-binding NtrC family response regulator
MISLRGYVILLVDDDADVRDVLEEMLQRAGAVVVTAVSGRHAARLIDTHRPDLVLTELLMRDGDGLWLLHHLRERRFVMPVVAMAGHLDGRSRAPVRRQGFADLIVKPVGPAALVRALAQCAPRAGRGTAALPRASSRRAGRRLTRPPGGSRRRAR